MVKLKQRTEVTWAAEVEFSSSSGAETCPLELEAAHRDQLTSASEQLETQRQVPRVDVVRRRRWLGRWDEN